MSGTRSRLRCWAVVFLVFSSLLVFGQFEDSETALRRADTALGQGRFDVALGIYERVLRENPTISISAERSRTSPRLGLAKYPPGVAKRSAYCSALQVSNASRYVVDRAWISARSLSVSEVLICDWPDVDDRAAIVRVRAANPSR